MKAIMADKALDGLSVCHSAVPSSHHAMPCLALPRAPALGSTPYFLLVKPCSLQGLCTCSPFCLGCSFLPIHLDKFRSLLRHHFRTTSLTSLKRIILSPTLTKHFHHQFSDHQLMFVSPVGIKYLSEPGSVGFSHLYIPRTQHTFFASISRH